MCSSSNHSSCRELGNHVTCSFTIQAIRSNNVEKMDSPSNGLSIVGYLRPAFIEEESYLRSLFHGECKSDGYSSDLKGTPVEKLDRNKLLSFSQILFDNPMPLWM